MRMKIILMKNCNDSIVAHEEQEEDVNVQL